MVCPGKKVQGLAHKTKRVCRFCLGTYLEARFTKDAHIISELLGNKYLVSDFECYDCNAQFSRCETDLASFIGIARTIKRTKGKKNPTLESADQQLRVEAVSFAGLEDAIMLSRTDDTNNAIEMDPATGKGSIRYIKPSYRPLFA